MPPSALPQSTEHIRNTTALTAPELERFEKTGYLRWESFLQFFSIDYVKAGFITKDKAGWAINGKRKSIPPSQWAYRHVQACWTSVSRLEERPDLQKRFRSQS